MKNIIFIFSIFIFFTSSLTAETSKEKGLSIAKKSYESTRGFVDSQSDQLMILINFYIIDILRLNAIEFKFQLKCKIYTTLKEMM